MTRERSPYRDIAATIIAEVISSVGRDDRKALRAALRKAYPFGKLHSCWPYQVWLEEIAKQAGTTVPPYLTRAEHEAMGDLFDA